MVKDAVEQTDRCCRDVVAM